MLNYLSNGAFRYQGIPQRYVDYTMRSQLMDSTTWEKFVQVFTTNTDDRDTGWRCEYWGKMMRGACLTYQVNGDEALYAVLEKTVRDMLAAQRPDGRFSTYSAEAQLSGWDIWGRKYVLTSMLHFYRICKDEVLKADILKAMCAHVDALMAKVGPGEGKLDITQTSAWWGGVNSCSILDAIVDLYTLTQKSEYLDFAAYIVSTGGCRDGNLIRLAFEDQCKPFEYPEVKAYETMSFFEGVMSYALVTGNDKLLDTVQKFVEAVAETDITIIGCSGCTHELFDHSSVMQTEYSETIMQETCVTVTWMRLLGRLFLLTGEEKYFARMELAAYNALYGSTNDYSLKQLSLEDKVWVDPLPFDSYSPLYNNTRGRGIGGFKRFETGGYYGCCACIAAAGVAIFPLCSTLRGDDGFVISGLHAGTLTETTPNGQPVTIAMDGGWPAEARFTLKIAELAKGERFTIKLRVPAYIHGAQVNVNGKTADVENGYAAITRIWSAGDTVELAGALDLVQHDLNGKIAFTRGPLVLARDQQKEASVPDLTESAAVAETAPTLLDPAGEYGEVLRMTLPRKDGTQLLLTDYASCGKHWDKENARMTVWMNP